MTLKKHILPTDKETNVKITKPAKVAAGITAVTNALRDASSQMGMIKCNKALSKLNQTKGFDCPSCAWPDPQPSERSGRSEYCENGARAVAEEATTARANPDFFAKHSIEEMMTWSERKLGKSGRLTHPMILKAGATHYTPISWDDAFKTIGTHLNLLDSPDEAIFYTSGRTSNEAAFLYQLFVRQYGTNNLPDCSNMCHESTGMGLSQTIGIGKGTVKLEDFYVAELILVIGQNPGTNHPRMLSALQKAKRAGAKVVSINPLPETGLKHFKNPQELRGWIGNPTPIADLLLQVRINGDIALLKAIMLLLLQMEEREPGSTLDNQFIQENTTGFAELVEDIKEHSIDNLSQQCGISIEDIRKTALLIKERKKMIICWAMGITQHVNGVDNVKEIVNLLLLNGSIGKPGAGACPVRGHSNVQGDRTMGIWEHLKPAFKVKLENRYQFEAPSKTGYNAVTAIQAMHNKKAKVFFSMGGNLLLAAPDTDYTAKAMRNCDLTVMVSTKPNRNHLVTGQTALILPCRGRTEIDEQASGTQFVSVENSMGIVHKSQGMLTPASEHLLSEPDMVARLAVATLGKNTEVNWEKLVSNYDLIRAEIEACIPGFDNYNERVRREGGFYLPNGPREGTFTTADKKAHFNLTKVPSHPLKESEYLMTTIRSHDQFNTTIYDNHDRYRGIHNGRRIVMMSKADMQAAGFKQGDYVDLLSHFKNKRRKAPNFMVVEYDIPVKCVATYFPEANVLVPVEQYAESYTPASKSVVITMERVEI